MKLERALGNYKPPLRQLIPQNSHNCPSPAVTEIPLKIPRSGSLFGSDQQQSRTVHCQ